MFEENGSSEKKDHIFTEGAALRKAANHPAFGGQSAKSPGVTNIYPSGCYRKGWQLEDILEIGLELSNPQRQFWYFQ